MSLLRPQWVLSVLRDPLPVRRPVACPTGGGSR